LGKEYLGLQGLFMSILAMLSVAELGVAPSIAYSLYKPLAEKDYPKVKALMRLYKRAYFSIGTVIAIVGLAVLPFFDKLITGGDDLKNVQVLYLLYLFGSVLSYFTSYKKSLLSADQKEYINVITLFIAALFIYASQITVLVLFQSFILFIVCDIIFNLIANLWIANKVSKIYPFLRRAKRIKLDRDTISILKKNVLGNFSHRIGILIVNASDNILISFFLSIATVGIFSNYWLIYINLQVLINTITISIDASVGHAAVGDETGKKTFDIYKKHYFITFCITAIFTTGFVYCLNPLMEIWLGKTYMFGSFFPCLVGVLFAIMGMRTGPFFLNALGMAWVHRFIAIAEAVCNIGFSLFFLLVLKMGVYGVVLGTICAVLVTTAWFHPYMLFKKAFFKPFKYYVRITLVYACVLITSVVLSGLIILFIPLSGILYFLACGIISMGVCAFMIWLVYRKTKEFNYLLDLLSKVFGRVFRRRGELK
jgi:O-antigen/teichoic acid export membrane protein